MSEIIRYRICDDAGRPLPGHSTEMPKPGETLDDLKARLRREYGARLIEMLVVKPHRKDP